MKASVMSAVLALAPSALAGNCRPKPVYEIQYTSVNGFFLQGEPTTNPSTFDYAEHNFGLINRTYPSDGHFAKGHSTQWQRFSHYVDELNNGHRGVVGPKNKVTYKLMFFGRHGEGYHNAAESFYGTPAWNCYYGELDGNGTVTWADAHLTEAGLAQAQKANQYYKRLMEDEGFPPFESYLSSPLSRCIQTAETTFGTLDLPHSHPFAPTIKELLREGISVHTCDRRMTKTEIHKFAPKFAFEAGFSEQDKLWRGNLDEGETSEHQRARSQVVLDDIFSNNGATRVSVTSHSGEIGSILAVLNHQPFSLATGQIIPVLIKAEYVEKHHGASTTTSGPSFTHEALCTASPVTSIAGQGCICSATAVPTVSALSR